MSVAASVSLGSMLPFAAVGPDVRSRPKAANHAATLNNYVPQNYANTVSLTQSLNHKLRTQCPEHSVCTTN